MLWNRPGNALRGPERSAIGSRPRMDSLLEPTLLRIRSEAPPSPYSLRAGFLVSFFGGGFAAVLFTGLGSRKLQRLPSDAPLLVLGTVLFALTSLGIGYGVASGAELPWIGPLTRERSSEVRLAQTALSLLFFGAAYLAHRRYYRAVELAGLDTPDPWAAALACGVAGRALDLGLRALAAELAS